MDRCCANCVHCGAPNYIDPCAMCLSTDEMRCFMPKSDDETDKPSLEEAVDLVVKDHYTTGGDHEQLRAHFIKELSDLLFVCYWMAAAVGVDIDEAFYRVWQSNMSKLGKDGRPVKREDGKVLKGPDYFLPVLKDLVRKTPITL